MSPGDVLAARVVLERRLRYRARASRLPPLDKIWALCWENAMKSAGTAARLAAHALTAKASHSESQGPSSNPPCVLSPGDVFEGWILSSGDVLAGLAVLERRLRYRARASRLPPLDKIWALCWENAMKSAGTAARLAAHALTAKASHSESQGPSSNPPCVLSPGDVFEGWILSSGDVLAGLAVLERRLRYRARASRLPPLDKIWALCWENAMKSAGTAARLAAHALTAKASHSESQGPSSNPPCVLSPGDVFEGWILSSGDVLAALAVLERRLRYRARASRLRKKHKNNCARRPRCPVPDAPFPDAPFPDALFPDPPFPDAPVPDAPLSICPSKN